MDGELERRPATATRMPERKHLNVTAAETIVEVITNPREMQTPYTFHTGVQNRRANTGLRAQKRESLREILVEGFRYNITIFVPPLSGPINLCPCAFRDADVHGLLAMTTSELRKYLLGRDGFPAIGLGNGKEQVPPLLRCELEAAFIIFGEDRH